MTTGTLKAAFVESAIDAISLRCLGFQGEIISLTGNAACGGELASKYRGRGYVVLAAFDADAAGEQMAETLGQPVERFRPPAGSKDWNEALCLKNQILFP